MTEENTFLKSSTVRVVKEGTPKDLPSEIQFISGFSKENKDWARSPVCKAPTLSSSTFNIA